MSNIHTPQRRALESIKPERLIPIVASLENKYYLDGKQIFLLGASEGIGTCSDLHGTYIAVFGKKRPTGPEFRPRFPRGMSKVKCAWAGLLHRPNDQEIKKWQRMYKTTCIMVVQGINPVKQKKNNVANFMNFVLTEKKKVYINTIT